MGTCGGKAHCLPMSGRRVVVAFRNSCRSADANLHPPVGCRIVRRVLRSAYPGDASG